MICISSPCLYGMGRFLAQHQAIHIIPNKLSNAHPHLVKPVCPLLHHDPSFRKVLCMVVRTSHFVPFSVGKLCFYHIMPIPPTLIKQSGSHSSETMHTHLILLYPRRRIAFKSAILEMQRVAEKGEGNISSPCPVHPSIPQTAPLPAGQGELCAVSSSSYAPLE